MEAQLGMQSKNTSMYQQGQGERRLKKTLISLCRKEQQGL